MWKILNFFNETILNANLYFFWGNYLKCEKNLTFWQITLHKGIYCIQKGNKLKRSKFLKMTRNVWLLNIIRKITWGINQKSSHSNKNEYSLCLELFYYPKGNFYREIWLICKQAVWGVKLTDEIEASCNFLFVVLKLTKAWQPAKPSWNLRFTVEHCRTLFYLTLIG